MTLPRSSGILVHPSSLPGPFGIGDIGPAAHVFVDFLNAAGQSLWQVLPLGPTGYGDSPYQCLSAFAGNPLLISPERLVADGWLEATDLAGFGSFDGAGVDFEHVIPAKFAILRKAFERFEKIASPAQRDRFERFTKARLHRGWLADWSLFMALKRHHGGLCWADWPAPLRDRQDSAIAEARRALTHEIRFEEFLQYAFFSQWADLKAHARQNGIALVGDVPIFVAYDSADVWANRDLFQLDKEGRPLAVAGVPPDFFSATGQLWGNPLYDWKRQDETRYAWWVARLKVALGTIDHVRLDHFRGFEAYWRVPAGSETAESGEWVKGPDAALFEALRQGLGHLPLIAEDLGVITPAVEALRDRFGLPGMKILQFAFADDATNAFLPHNYVSNSVVYSGTHDNDTTAGWFASASDKERQRLADYLGTSDFDPAWALIRLAEASVASWAIVPFQDVLSVGAEGRMNLPGRASGNWSWRFPADRLTVDLAGRLAAMARTYGRILQSD